MYRPVKKQTAPGKTPAPKIRQTLARGQAGLNSVQTAAVAGLEGNTYIFHMYGYRTHWFRPGQSHRVLRYYCTFFRDLGFYGWHE